VDRPGRADRRCGRQLRASRRTSLPAPQAERLHAAGHDKHVGGRVCDTLDRRGGDRPSRISRVRAPTGGSAPAPNTIRVIDCTSAIARMHSSSTDSPCSGRHVRGGRSTARIHPADPQRSPGRNRGPRGIFLGIDSQRIVESTSPSASMPTASPARWSTRCFPPHAVSVNRRAASRENPPGGIPTSRPLEIRTVCAVAGEAIAIQRMVAAAVSGIHVVQRQTTGIPFRN